MAAFFLYVRCLKPSGRIRNAREHGNRDSLRRERGARAVGRIVEPGM